jgi:hypothetical protein
MLSQVKNVVDLLADHMELAQLEYRYEASVMRRRFRVFTAAILFTFCSWVLIQIAVLDGLSRLKFPLCVSALILAGFNLAVGLILCDRYGRRDKRAGEPFSASQEELKRSLQWIQRSLS